MTATSSTNRHQKLNQLLEQSLILDEATFERRVAHHIEYSIGKYKHNTTASDIYQAVALTIRDALVDRYNATQEEIRNSRSKRVYYISMEFLLGRLLDSNLINIDAREIAAKVVASIGYQLDDILEREPDAGLGNGGLGRLAACFLDSLSSLGLPSTGAGLRYEFGIFHQHIIDGYQNEAPDVWLSMGNPWEVIRADIVHNVGFYGHTERFITATGETAVRWIPGESIRAVAHDLMIPGFRNNVVNNLRLWAARASSDFNFDYFNHGDYLRAVEDKQRSENISKVLYPNENMLQGKELRLKQEYMLVSATLQDAIKNFISEEKVLSPEDWERLPDRLIFQLNDTHPALAVADMMRLLVDIHDLPWEMAWKLTRKVLAYTNHTVLPEALERWDLEMFQRLLPRHMEIIFHINHLFIEELKSQGTAEHKLANLSIIEEGQPRRVRMANLAIVGSNAVNGVAALHTQLIKKFLFADFNELWPDKIRNKTNGIAHRRWILSSNPLLTELISSRIGDGWIYELQKLRELEPLADNHDFQQQWDAIKLRNKERLAKIIQFECGVRVDPHSIFDVQIKRIHEYKRQLLAALLIIRDYQMIKANPGDDYQPRTVIFGGKAAPGYHMAKLIIKLIHSVAEKVNNDPIVAEKLRVVFLPNYSVSLAEKIFPASDLSTQISTAGMEASGTGNMKFMLNGALTVGTLDGANIEIKEEVGDENIYIFGHTVEQIAELNHSGYNPVALYKEDPEIRRILDAIRGNYFNQNRPGLFQEIFHNLTYGGDFYKHLADFRSFSDAHQRIAAEYRDRPTWLRKSILNTARCGKFSSDRTIQQYADDIWKLKPIQVSYPK